MSVMQSFGLDLSLANLGKDGVEAFIKGMIKKFGKKE